MTGYLALLGQDVQIVSQVLWGEGKWQSPWGLQGLFCLLLEHCRAGCCGTIALQATAWLVRDGHCKPTRGQQRFEVRLL